MKLIKQISIVLVLIASMAVWAAAQGSSQSSSASKTAKFGTVAATDASVTGAIDAHDLKKAATLVGKKGAFTGTVTKLYSPKSGSLVILNFDADYKTALTAVVKRDVFGKFPDLSKLEGKTVLVKGKFVEFKGAIEMDLSDAADISVIEK